MLLFQKRFHAGLVSGAVRFTFRQWEKPRVRVGGRYRVHPIGVVAVEEISRVQLGSITREEAIAAGFADLSELLSYLREFTPELEESSELWRIRLHHGGDGDRVEIALSDKLTAEEVEALDKRLTKLDGKKPWVRATLKLILRRPRIAASKLAVTLKRDKFELKEDIRKLKRLGLTQSFEVGYELSPRGRTFLRLWKKKSLSH